jgi:valyl-tRNA synthetase
MAMITGAVETIRNIRGEMGFPPAQRIEVQIRANGHRDLFKAYEYYVKELARISEITYINSGEKPERAALGIFKDVELFVPIRDMEVVRRESARVEKELARISAEADRVFNKINNRAFREKAPEVVLQKEEVNFQELSARRDKLLASKEMLEGLLKG